MQRLTVTVGSDGRVEIPGTRAGQLMTIQVEPKTLTVEDDGRVKIPGTAAGQTITIFVEPEPAFSQRPLRTESPEERERIKKVLREGAKRARAEATPEEIERAVNHGDWLYGPDGLPR